MILSPFEVNIERNTCRYCVGGMRERKVPKQLIATNKEGEYTGRKRIFLMDNIIQIDAILCVLSTRRTCYSQGAIWVGN